MILTRERGLVGLICATGFVAGCGGLWRVVAGLGGLWRVGQNGTWLCFANLVDGWCAAVREGRKLGGKRRHVGTKARRHGVGTRHGGRECGCIVHT